MNTGVTFFSPRPPTILFLSVEFAFEILSRALVIFELRFTIGFGSLGFVGASHIRCKHYVPETNEWVFSVDGERFEQGPDVCILRRNPLQPTEKEFVGV